jgi:hypothetical protein
MFRKFNNWYDSIKEPKRFLFFFFCIGLPFSLAMTDLAGSADKFLPIWLDIPIVGLVLCIVISRVMRSTEKKVEKK